MSNSVKVLIWTIITFIATTISTSGFPAITAGWIILGVTTVGTTLVYIAKNWVFPSVSIFGNIDLRDVLSGLILAIGAGVSDWAGHVIAGVVIDWHSLWVTVGSITAAYFVKIFATPKPKE